jgi:hypothetical protein
MSLKLNFAQTDIYSKKIRIYTVLILLSSGSCGYFGTF